MCVYQRSLLYIQRGQELGVMVGLMFCAPECICDVNVVRYFVTPATCIGGLTLGVSIYRVYSF